MHVMAEQIKDISTYLIKALKVLLYLSDSDTEMLFYLLFTAIAINEMLLFRLHEAIEQPDRLYSS